ncbi:MAG: chalcone isomerase family protein [Acidiferrobacterales bacterium]
MKALLLPVSLVAALLTSPANAAKVAGVKLDDTTQLAGATLVLNGAGVRKKFFVKVYVGALYLANKVTTTEAALNESGPKRVLMHFLYKKVEREKLVEGWNVGFNSNSKADMSKLQARLNDFNKLFTDANKGDVILMDYVPGTGTQVTINGKPKGTIPGADFSKALLKVWLGAEPADSGLKRAMLGS